MNLRKIKATKKDIKTRKSENRKTGKRLGISYFKKIKNQSKNIQRRLFVQESDRIPLWDQ